MLLQFTYMSVKDKFSIKPTMRKNQVEKKNNKILSEETKTEALEGRVVWDVSSNFCEREREKRKKREREEGREVSLKLFRLYIEEMLFLFSFFKFEKTF